MKVILGNGFYFMYIVLALVFFATLLFILRKKSEKTIRIVLIVILFINFALHFLKQAFPPYINNMPKALEDSTLVNICAVSTFFFPFVYLIKKHTVLHDYVFFIGMLGGLLAVFYPTEALGEFAFSFDVIRFYFCHSTLFVVPLVAALLGLYRPRLKSFWAIPLLFLAQSTIICLNEMFLIKVGLVDAKISDLLNKEFRNYSFVFGLKDDFSTFAFLFDPLIPFFLKTDAFNINGGTAFYFPVLWQIIPAFVYLIPLYIIISSPFWIYTCVKKAKSTKKT